MDRIPQISLPPKYRRCLYEMAKEVYHYGSPKHVTYEQVLQTIFFCSSLRILHMAYLMAVGYPTWYAYRHDVMLSFCRLNAHRFDYSLMVAIYLFNVVYTSLEYWIYSSVDERAEVWKWWWTVTVRNQQLYNQALYSSLEVEAIQEVRRREIAYRLQKDSLFGILPGALLIPLTGLLARWEVFYSLEGADLGRLQEGGDCSLPLRPKISWPLRRQTLRIILIAEYLTYYFQLFVGELFCERFCERFFRSLKNITFFSSVAIYWSVIALVVLTYPNWSAHSVLGIAYGFCEVAGAFYVLFRLIRFLNLFTVTTLLGTVTFTGHLLESQRSIEKLIAKYAQLRLPLPVRFRPLLDQFFDDHSLTGKVEIVVKLLETFKNTPKNVFSPPRYSFPGARGQ